MGRMNRAQLCLEHLEQRWVPATIKLVGSNLFVSNLSGPAPVLTATIGAGTIAVQDGGGPTLTFKASNLFITGTNKNDTITVTGATMTGNLFINSGNGNDLVTISAAAVRGNVTVLTGFGNDSLVLSTAVGGVSSLTDTLGTDTLVVAGTQGGDVTAFGYNTVTLA